MSADLSYVWGKYITCYSLKGLEPYDYIITNLLYSWR